MKKKIALILVLCVMATILYGCSISYEEANNNPDDFSAGYFTTIKQWGGGFDYPVERIVYANDTHVIYYIFSKGYQGGITPLYNADGTLQIWEGE